MKSHLFASALLPLALPVVSLAADTVAWPTPTGPVKAYFDSIWEPRVVAVTYVQHKDGEELRSIVAVRMSAEDLRP